MNSETTASRIQDGAEARTQIKARTVDDERNCGILPRVGACYYRTESTACRKTRGPNPLRTIIRILSLLLPESVLKLPWRVENKDERSEPT